MKIRYKFLGEAEKNLANFPAMVIVSARWNVTGADEFNVYGDYPTQSKNASQICQIVLSKKLDGLVLYGDWESQPTDMCELIKVAQDKGLEIMIRSFRDVSDFYGAVGENLTKESNFYEDYAVSSALIGDVNILEHLGMIAVDSSALDRYYLVTNVEPKIHLIVVGEDEDES
jgi:hypothetical protein